MFDIFAIHDRGRKKREKMNEQQIAQLISHFTSVDVHKTFHKTHVIQVDYGDHRQALRPFSRKVNMCFTFLYGRAPHIGFTDKLSNRNLLSSKTTHCNYSGYD